MLPLLEKSETGIGMIANITSEAGSIGACYRTNMLDYAIGKCALNMATKTLHNSFKDKQNINIKCIHPGWMHTYPGGENATYDPYDSAEIMRHLFDEKRTDKTGPIFITYEGEEYPW